MIYFIPIIKSFFSRILIAFHKPYDTSIESNRALERERRIALTSLVAALEKIITTAIPLITVRVTYNYLGCEIYGLWNAVVNFFALFAFSDLGLGYGLQTRLSQASGKNDLMLCRQLISSTYFVLCVVASFLFVVFMFLYPFIDWSNVMNANSGETSKLVAPIVFVIVLPKLLSIPTAIISRTQLALQEGYNYCAWAMFGSVFSLLYICVVSYFDLGKIILLAGAAFIPFLCSVLNMVVYYGWQRKEYRFGFKFVRKEQAANLLQIGLNFCFLSILTTLGLAMDTFIVARVCSLEDAGVYAILSKVMYIVSAVLTILAQPLWGANGEALSRGDIEWVKSNTKKTSLIMFLITLTISAVIVILSRWLFRLWLGRELDFSLYCLIWMCLFQLCTAFISPYFMVLNASGLVKKQILIFSIFTPLCFVFKIVFGRLFGMTAIPIVGTVLYFFIIVIFVHRITKQHLNSFESSN